ncbi:glycosyltransferase family 4 protein [Litorivicinus sp.]|nr:glycosyltransferase family 4 protein [Litorivicinus sp.]MDC1240001.1 glycosyltransferase family 4 protein [Litorivicinus sp.]
MDKILPPLRVGNIIEESRVGGPQTRMINVARCLKEDVNTTIIAPTLNSANFQKCCHENGISFKKVPMATVTSGFFRVLKYILLFPVDIFLVCRILVRENIQVVHVSGGSWQYKGLIAGKILGKKVLWHLNDTYSPYIVRSIFSVVNRLADGFIFASERTKLYYSPMIKQGRKSYIIPAPVDTSRFSPELKFRDEVDLLRSWENKFVVGTIANVNPVKGLETFIRTAKCLNDFVFVIVGTVFKSQIQYYQNLVNLCKELGVTNVVFVGGRADVRPLLKRFDLYVCSSSFESSPISVWEAMAMAKPIISTDVGDVAMYVRDDLNGFIVAVGDHDSLVGRINQLKDDESLRLSFGCVCRESAKSKLDILCCARKHAVAYQEVLQ